MSSQNDIRVKGKFFAVNTRMIPSKLAFLLYGGHLGGYLAFFNIFFISTGLSKFQAGIITGINYGTPIIAGPIWGYLADYTGRRRLILVILCIGASFPTFSMPWIAHSIYPKSHYQCNMTNATNATPGANGTDMFTTIANENCEELKRDAINTLFQVLLSLVTIVSVFLIPLPLYIDTIVINVVKSGTRKASYGGQRMFVSIGFSLVNYLAGKSADHYKEPDMSPYTAVFFFFLPCTLLLIPAGCYLIGQVNYDNAEATKNEDLQEKNVNKERLYKQVLRLFRRFDVIFFMTTVFISGLAINLFLHFSYMLVTDVMKKTKTEMTFVKITSTVSEMLLFPMTTKIIKILGGTSTAMILGTFANFARFLVMSFNVPFGVLVGTQILSALSFALSWSAMLEHVHEISPKAINATMNAFTLAIFGGVSNLVANIIGAKMYELYGGRNLFFGEALLCLAWTVVMIIYYGGKRLRKHYLHNAEEPVAFSPEIYIERRGSITRIDNIVLEMDDNNTVSIPNGN